MISKNYIASSFVAFFLNILRVRSDLADYLNVFSDDGE